MDRQKDVLFFFNGDKTKELTKAEIIKGAGLYYYHNGNKHAGDVLSRMVKRGLLIRVRKGVFRLGNGTPKKEIIINPNQISLI